MLFRLAGPRVFQTMDWLRMRLRYFKHTHKWKTTQVFLKQRRMRLFFDAKVIFKPTQTSNFASICCLLTRKDKITSRIRLYF